MACKIWNEYGVLSLPVALMVPFGHFGIKLKQMKHKTVAIIINSVLMFSYILCLFIGISTLLGKSNFKNIKVLFNTGFNIMIILLFSVWAFNYFKKFNFLSLVDQIKDERSHSLTIKDWIYITFAICSTGSVLMLMNFNVIKKHFFSKTNIFKVIEIFLYTNVSWTLIFNTSFSLCCVTVVVSREFKKCVSNFKEIITEQNYFSDELFHETAERLRTLTCIVDQVDAMFSGVVGLVLSTALGMLCGAIYGILNYPLENWGLVITVCVVSLIILLPPLTVLNRSVSFTLPMTK